MTAVPTFHVMRSKEHAAMLVGMMRALYAEDPASTPPDPAHFPKTIDAMLSDPHRGSIVLIMLGHEVVGYAIVVPFYSNELGGTLAFLDELFVTPPVRGQGIASAVFAFLREARPFNAIGILLEVTPSNTRAFELYSRMGFQERTNRTMVLRY
jgi:ribosomal protein S18 acetylase RimI-like enzyme